MFAATLSESLGSLLAATVAFAVGSSVFLRDRTRPLFARFALFCGNLGLFHLFRFLAGFSGTHLFGWAADVVALALPWTADRCFSSLVGAPEGASRAARLRSALGAGLLLVLLAGLFVPGLATHPAWDVVPPLSWAYVVFGLLLAAQRLLSAARRNEGTAAAERLRYLYLASILALAFGSAGAFGLGPVVTAIYLYFVAQTLVRERLLDLPEVVGRILSLSLLVVLVTALYVLLLSWVPVRGGSALFFFNAAVASFAVVVLVDPVRSEIDARIETLLFRDRIHLRGVLTALRRRLQRVLSPDEMTDVLLRALAASNRVTRAAVYLLDRTGSRLERAGYLGRPPPAAIELATFRPLVARMLRDGAVVRDVVEREHARAPAASRAELGEILAALEALGAAVAVPMLRPADEQDLLGILCLDDERLQEPFSRQEIGLFAEVAAQAAVTLENSAAFEARKERDRLAALGAMAAGLAHEIRNPLGAIKGAVQVLEPSLSRTSAHTREFFGVIEDEVDRLNRVVSQFLAYSRPFSGERAPVELAPVLHRAVRLLRPEQRARVDEDPESLAGLVAWGDADALCQVFHNLLRNAAEAVADRGEDARIQLTGGRDAHTVHVQVRDDGPGLPPAVLENLFVPFHTTKPGGTGLGLPISQRIVETLGGRIEAANAPGGGALFTVTLPAVPASGAPRSP